MNNDLISRRALLEKTIGVVVYDEGGWDCNVRAVTVDVVENAPAVDAVEVVRCKNCRYIRPEVDAFTHEVVGHWCSLLDIGSVEYDHFCSYGERRADRE